MLLNELEPPARGLALAVDGVDGRPGGEFPWGAVVGGVLGAGVALRMLWLAVGLGGCAGWPAVCPTRR